MVASDKLGRNTLVRYKVILLSAAILFLGFFAVSSAFGQESSSSAENSKKFNIIFPIAELGNCSSVEDCKAFCNETINQQVCIDFAKAKGLKRNEQKGVNTKLLEKAKSFLGCDSAQSCREFCQQEANFEKCSLFARENKLKGGIKNASASADVRREMRRDFEGTNSGVPGPKSGRAYEKANENAKFCREYPEKCLNSSNSADLKESYMKKLEKEGQKMEKRLEKEKKELEKREEKYKKEVERALEMKKKPAEEEFEKKEIEVEDELEGDDSNVQGVSTSSSLIDKIYRLLFK